jgi:hypothetical protein
LWSIVALAATGLVVSWGLCGAGNHFSQTGRTEYDYLSVIGLWLFIISGVTLIASLILTFIAGIFGDDK